MVFANGVVFLAILSFVVTNDFLVVDYFIAQEVPRVVGFSCNDIEKDIWLVKTFSKFGITTKLEQLNLATEYKWLMRNVYWKLGIFLDLRCSNISDVIEIFALASRFKLYNELNYWLVLGEDLQTSIAFIDDSSFSIATNFIIAVPNIKGYALYDVFNHCKMRGGILNVLPYGTWSEIDGININQPTNKFRRRSNFKGIPMKMASLVVNRPKDIKMQDYLQDFKTKDKDRSTKFGYSVMLHIAEMFNFTIEPIEYTEWRDDHDNLPLMKGIVNGEIDFSGSPVLLSSDYPYLISGVPIWPMRTCFIFSTLGNSIKPDEFTRYLTYESWYSTIGLILFSTFVLAMTFVTDKTNTRLQRYSNAALATIGSFCQQGADVQADQLASRLALLQILMFGILMFNYYSANLVAVLMDSNIEKINDSLSELSRLDLKFSGHPSLPIDLDLQRPDWEAQVFKSRKWRNVPEGEKYVLTEIGMKRLLEGRFAYHTDPNVAYPYIEKFTNQDICEMVEVHILRPTEAFILVGLDGPLFETMKIGIARLRETGIRLRQLKRWSARSPLCRTDLLTVKAVNIYSFAPALILVMLGILLASAICLIERGCFIYKSRRNYIRKKLKERVTKCFGSEILK